MQKAIECRLYFDKGFGVLKENAKADISVFNGDMQKDFKKALFDIKMVMKSGVVEAD